MKYIKLYENYNSDEEDVEHILTDYYHDSKCEIIKNDYYKLYKFSNLSYYNKAIKELNKHNLKYKKVLVDDDNDNRDGYIITQLSKEVIDFLDERLLSLETREYKHYVYYLYGMDARRTKTYYDKKEKIFWIDSSLPKDLRSTFNIDLHLDYSMVIITWYINSVLNQKCMSVFTDVISIDVIN